MDSSVVSLWAMPGLLGAELRPHSSSPESPVTSRSVTRSMWRRSEVILFLISSNTINLKENNIIIPILCGRLGSQQNKVFVLIDCSFLLEFNF